MSEVRVIERLDGDLWSLLVVKAISRGMLPSYEGLRELVSEIPQVYWGKIGVVQSLLNLAVASFQSGQYRGVPFT